MRIFVNFRRILLRRQRLRSHLKGLIQSGIIAGVIGIVYMLLVYGYALDDLLQAFFICFLISILCQIFEIFIFNVSLKRSSSYKVFTIRFVWYQLSLLFSFSLGIAIFNNLDLYSAFQSIDSTDKTIAGWTVIAFNFVILVNRWMGRNALWLFFRGVYTKPVFERKIILFLKIPWKSAMQSNSEFRQHHSLLQNFIEIATEIILDSEGRIYRYEPDGILVTFKECEVKNVLSGLLKLHHNYSRHFQASLTIDNICIAETGDYKKEILMLSPSIGPSIVNLRNSKYDLLLHENFVTQKSNPDSFDTNQEFNCDKFGYYAMTWTQLNQLTCENLTSP